MFAFLALPLSATAHVLGGGERPASIAVLAGLAFSFLLHRGLLVRQERSWASLFAGLGLAQVVVHTLLWLTEDAPADGPALVTAAHHAHGLSSSFAVTAGADLTATHGGHYGPGMLAGHVVAAALLAWLLRHGEVLLWSAARRLTWAAVACWRRACRAAARCRPSAACLAGCPAPHADRRPLRRQQLLWTAGQIRRGPPQVCRAG